MRIYYLLFTLLASTSLWADEYEVVFSACYGNSQRAIIEGRIIEKRSHAAAEITDSWIKNTWRKLRQLINDEQADTLVKLEVNQQHFHKQTDDEGYFSFDILLSPQLPAGFYPAKTFGNENLSGFCRLLVIPQANTLAIISDFDDTVIVSNVVDKKQLITNSLAKNYLQRDIVQGMPNAYRDLLKKHNPLPELAPVIFVSGSPRQIQLSIEQFLDHYHFPTNMVLTKQIGGEQGDPLLNQQKYKVDKIEKLFKFFSWMQFILIGDDGEKDPESYRLLQQRYPDRIHSIWIRKVSVDDQRLTYDGQHYFKDGLSLTKDLNNDH